MDREFARVDWPNARVYSCCGDKGQVMVEFEFDALEVFQSGWDKFQACEIKSRLLSELGVELEPDSECRQLYSTQYLRTALDGGLT